MSDRRFFAHRSRRQLACLIAAGASAVTAQAASAQQYTLQHTNQIDLGALFGPNGSNPSSVAFDGTNAYVGGFNNGSAAANVSIVKLTNVLTPSPVSATLAGTGGTFLANSNGRGINALAYDRVGGALYSAYDSGGAATSTITRLDPTTGATTWQISSPNGQRPFALAIDPRASGTNAGVAFLAQGSGRRLALNTADGSSLYTTSTGAIINASVGVASTTHRALAFDSAGNILIGLSGQYQYGVRVTDNQFSTLAIGTTAAALNVTTRAILKSANTNNIGNGVAILENAGTSALSLIAFAGVTAPLNSTATITGTAATAATSSWNSAAVQIRNTDGSLTGLTQASLLGGEDGIGSNWTGQQKDLYAVKDASGNPVLLAVSFQQRLLDVYQLEPTWTSPTSGNWGTSGNWLVGLVPNSATLNAAFSGTTPQTITLDAAQTTKNLKLNNAAGYTFAGTNALTIDAPDGQRGQITVLSGAHTLSAPVLLNKTTVVNTGTAAGSVVFTGALTSAGTAASGLTITGNGTATLASNATLTGTLTIDSGLAVVQSGATASFTGLAGTTAGALDVQGTLNIAGQTSAAPITLNARASNLSIATNGVLFLANNNLIVDYAATATTTLTDLQTWLVNGLTAAPGPKITTNPTGLGAYTDKSATLALFDNAVPQLTAWNGAPVGTNAVIGKFTYFGDANIDGVVDANDYGVVDAFIGQTGTSWLFGDLNFDGITDDNDYGVIDAFIGTGTGEPLGQPSAGAAAIPEPASLSLVALAAAGLIRRRRR